MPRYLPSRATALRGLNRQFSLNKFYQNNQANTTDRGGEEEVRVKVLSCRSHLDCNRECWWYNLISPENWLERDPFFTLVLNGKDNSERVGSIIIPLNSEWRKRILKAPRCTLKGSKAIKAHVYKVRQSGEYWIYFGKVKDGVYPVKLQQE
jgi:hypothetical protein